SISSGASAPSRGLLRRAASSCTRPSGVRFANAARCRSSTDANTGGSEPSSALSASRSRSRALPRATRMLILIAASPAPLCRVLAGYPAEKRSHEAGLFPRLSPLYLELVDHFAGVGDCQFVEALTVEVIEHLLRLFKRHARFLGYLGNGHHTMVLAGQVKNLLFPGFERASGRAHLGVSEEPDA